MKAILFIILSSISVLINAQTLKAFLYTANFNSLENKSYIETYLSFDVNTVQLIQDKNDKYFGELDIYIEISKSNKFIFNDHYTLRSPYFKDSVANNLLFIDQQRIALENGEYLLTIKVKDIHADDEMLVHKENIIMDFR